MSKPKPKPIRRHGPTGPQELSQVLTPAATDEELMRACIQLGQTTSQAEETIAMYREGILDGADSALMEEAVKESRSNKPPSGMTFKREQPATIGGKRIVRSEGNTRQTFTQDVESLAQSVAAAHHNPRDPNNSKQRVTRRDRFGRVIGLEDV